MKNALLAALAIATVSAPLATAPADAQRRDYRWRGDDSNWNPSDNYRRGNYRERRLGRNDRVYRGDDGRAYCRRNDGTTGLVIGGVGGGVLGNIVGGGTLGTLRAAMLAGDPDRAAPRVHPMVAVRTAGDLLVRAGFALPVADTETLSVRYSGVDSLIRDLRGMGAASLLADRAPLSRAAAGGAAAAFAGRANADGRTTERFEVVTLTGWAPAPGQPQPARRGSATASLAQALRRD